ncbi:unnamed protein product [Bursaphelenchus okinawaensis]|uniref:Aldehyde dehydrogenase n=1 Tax=Bursaphelenchus okinawaensis TaxID=465554 RepID=A0A811LUB7_9BILA|nr:unnamed protein product [Bursaphelenchus okinawaensis]CAG9128193.1 unnamed protein product [Bursaphelenchus okinawaensis]
MVHHFDKLVQAQRDFFNSGVTFDVEWRKKQLSKLKESLEKHIDAIADALWTDLRRHKALARPTEIDTIFGDIDYFLANIEQWSAPEERKGTENSKAYLYKQPKGVALIISPFNYPVQLALKPLIAAIGAGCTAIIKPSEMTENCAQVLDDIVSTAFSPEYVTVVQGDASTSSALLEQRFDHIFYTGGTQIGKIVMTAAAQHLTTVTLELGGQSPCYVDQNVDVDEVVSKILMPKYLNNGQTCITVNHLILHEKVKDELQKKFIQSFVNVFGKNPKSNPLYARIVTKKHWSRIHRLITASKGKVLFKSDDDDDHEDKFIAPYIVEVEKDDALLDEELFAPVLPILTVKSGQEALELVKSSGERPLASYIFSKNDQLIDRFNREILAGATVANDVLIQYFNHDIPFGGIGNSGMGRTQGKYGFDSFTHEKPVVISTSSNGGIGI